MKNLHEEMSDNKRHLNRAVRQYYHEADKIDDSINDMHRSAKEFERQSKSAESGGGWVAVVVVVIVLYLLFGGG